MPPAQQPTSRRPETFDPYHKWLGIPPGEQPADHYRLLGIARFESDPDVIETAADQRMALLRTLQTGSHSALSQKLLNELSAARLCLLTPQKKSAYDAELRRRVDAGQRAKPARPAAALNATPMLPLAPVIVQPEAPAVIVTDRDAGRRATGRRPTGISRAAYAWLSLAAVAIPAILFVGYLIWAKHESGRERISARPPDAHASSQRVAPPVPATTGKANSARPAQASAEKQASETGNNGPVASPVPAPDAEKWLLDVSTLPAEQQVTAVAGKLKQLNPGFDGTLKPIIENGSAVEITLLNDAIVDLSPLRAFPKLARLHLPSQSGESKLTDLAPLKGMPLTQLSIRTCKLLRNLEPLHGMPLTRLSLAGCNEVRDLTPLKGMPLTWLELYFCSQVADLTPLHGIKLNELTLGGTAAKDLTPLKGMPLTLLNLHAVPVTDLAPLRGMPLKDLYLSDCSQLNDLSPLKGLPLTRLNIGGSNLLDLSLLAGMPLVELGLHTCHRVTDLTPLKTLPLKRLILSHCSQLRDLTPLQGVPLTYLNLHCCEVVDLAPLGTIPLTELDLSGCGKVQDLTPLAVMPLTFLDLNGCSQVQDLTSLGSMPLETILFNPANISRGIDSIRRIRTLKKVGAVMDTKVQWFTADEFWTHYDAGKPKPENIASAEGKRDAIKESAPAKSAEAAPRIASNDVPRAEPPNAKQPTPAEPPTRAEGAAASATQNAKLTATEAFSLEEHTVMVTHVAFNREWPVLASGARDGHVLLWNLENRALQLKVHWFPEWVSAIKFSPDGSLLAFANRAGGGSHLCFKTLTGQELKVVKDFQSRRDGSTVSIAYSHDGRLLAAGQQHGSIRLWDTEQNQEILPPVSLGVGHNINSLAFGSLATDRKKKQTAYLLAAACQDGTVKTYTATFAKNKKDAGWTFAPTSVSFPKSAPVASVRFSHDGKLLGYTRHDGNVCLSDPRTGATVRVLAEGGQGIDDCQWIAFHPRQPWCITAHKEPQVARIWNTKTAAMLCELKGHTGTVTCAEFSPDGRHVATASEDLSVKLWDLSGDDVPKAAKGSKNAKPAAPTVGD